MKVQVPIEVMDESCMKCDNLDIQVNGVRDLWAGDEIVAREFDIRCSHVRLCERLRKRFKEARHDG